MKTTLADLVINARAAAQAACAITTALEQQTAKLQAYTESKFHPDDFPTWENAFNAEMEMLAAFSKQPSPATAAAAKKLVGEPPALQS